MKQRLLLSFFGKALLLIATINLTACGLTQMVSDGTRSAANAIFYKQVKVVHLDFVAREALNTDDTGTSLSTIIRVYQLKNFESFAESDYATLFAKDSQVLKSSLVTQKDLRIRPGESISLDMPLEKEAEFVAVAAMFHHPDLVTDNWRVIIPKKRLLPDEPRLLTLLDNTITLKPLGEK
ncbi:type VI secretion system lipoprotein TssJ [Providencia vermicola]|uniref:type VI secretion system lipoprotein TssJ n=1 Tax=Providencia vermicola TaxID=333965 RepID=UPI0013A785B7|nr:type VI secretion system lipoprotein TssJ [Providencia vermicola]QIC16671.1 type VI secretion system lipoprotein TssJ [Providencia vermicola]